MVKCVVSGCPNRVVTVNIKRGIFNRPPKRFFSFPKDSAQVKVWLAALRETDKQDSIDQHLICEDHFLPEDISTNGVNSGAIPIMPPDLDGPMGMISSWGAELSEEEDQWATSGGDDDDDDAYQGGLYGSVKVEPPEPVPLAPVPLVPVPPAPVPLAPLPPAPVPPALVPPPPKPPAVDPPQQDPGAERTSGARTTSVSLHESEEMTQTKVLSGVSLGVLVQRFLELMLMTPDGSLDLREATESLQTRRRRVYDITNVLEGISLIKKQSASRFKWIGRCEISSFLLKDQQTLQAELENLELVEDTLDALIKSCSQQLFDVTDNLENAAFAYVTHEDISRLRAFQEQTVMVVKAPEETKLEVPAPTEDNIQVHLKGGQGPITVFTCDIGAGNVSREKSSCFLTLEESRIKTAVLHTESSSPQTAVQST